VDWKASWLFSIAYIWKSCIRDVQYLRSQQAGFKIQKICILGIWWWSKGVSLVGFHCPQDSHHQRCHICIR
jgi:hypothetical protein